MVSWLMRGGLDGMMVMVVFWCKKVGLTSTFPKKKDEIFRGMV